MVYASKPTIMARKSSRPTTRELRIRDDLKLKQTKDAAEQAAMDLIEAQNRFTQRCQMLIRISGNM